MSNSTLQGWGRGTWGQGPWNEEINVVVTGLVGTTGLGTPSGIPGVNVAATGISATTSISQTGAGTVTYAVTVVSGNPSNHPYYNQGSTNKYAIDGSTASGDVVLTLYEGNTYKFDQSDSSNDGHPLRFYLDAAKGTAYTTGVTTNGTPGQAGAYTQITVADGAPTLFYQCSSHSLMGATANTLGIPNVSTTTGASVTNVIGTTALGSETVVTEVTVGVTLAAAQTTLDSVVTIPQCVVFLTGISATGGTGEELVYSLIVPDQIANWREVA